MKSGFCTLKDVIYVPDVSANLISVSVITKNGGEVFFKRNEVIVKKNNKNIFKGRKKENDLYEVELKSEIKEKSYAARKINATNLWHRKLGHLIVEGMKNLLNVSESVNINSKDLKDVRDICETCVKAKQAGSRFKNSDHALTVR